MYVLASDLPNMSSAVESSLSSNSSSSSSSESPGASKPRMDESRSNRGRKVLAAGDKSVAPTEASAICCEHMFLISIAPNVVAFSLLHHGPRKPRALAARVDINRTFEELSREGDIFFSRFQYPPCMKQARGVSILWINPYASLKQIARAIDFSRSPLRHRPCVPVRLVLGIHHRPLLKVLARLFQIPLLCIELCECLKQMRVQGIQFASLGQELLRAVAIPELGFPHPPTRAK